ncbi:hypothetical protein [Rhizobium sp. K102]|jgi:hypothetical protein|uniref:hypothetical protein n=1 Tax=Rhizobium sp. K102 TaxID=2918527 RepID=UPI001EFA8954|nr:hypothetical protein [Rhizobium sp. K102]ULR45155.1 hypothetical protein MHI61_08035 [Rhizobium sp. K102]
MAGFVAIAQRTGRSLKLENNIQHKLVDYVDNVSHVFYAAKRRRISAPSYPQKPSQPIERSTRHDQPAR